MFIRRKDVKCYVLLCFFAGELSMININMFIYFNMFIY